jgi:hypothetical protein
MPRYRVLERSFINNSTFEPGSIVEYEGEVAGNLELIKEPKVSRGKPAKGEDPAVAETVDDDPAGEDLV